MDPRKIEDESNSALGALSKLNIAISQAKASLENLKKEESEYLDLREIKAKERVSNVLEETKDIQNEINLLSSDISKFIIYFNDFILEINNLKELTKNYSDDLLKKFEDGEKDFIDKLNFLKEEKEKIKLNKIKLNSIKEGLDKQKSVLETDRRVLEDKRAAFDRAWNEIKK